ncbi:MAG TPA: hypothetical protein VMU25_03800 [Candidatus Paceibacterota bacterium]|nr:hypothetical protein [Candidatus Paceibacterota bacterium]
MASNFLGDVGGSAHRGSPILSAAELIAREGVELQKGMNYRDNAGLLSVFLVLDQGDGFRDEWDPESEMYVFQGHDSTTVESGKLKDQIAMYADGRMSDNGKFLKAANAFKDGVRDEPLQVQVYEKLDPGVWFDKGIFNLADAKHVTDSGRKVFKFYLNPASNRAGSAESDEDDAGRMLSAAEKESVWKRDGGRCAVCDAEAGLHFVAREGKVRLLCEPHAGRKRGLLG